MRSVLATTSHIKSSNALLVVVVVYFSVYFLADYLTFRFYPIKSRNPLPRKNQSTCSSCTTDNSPDDKTCRHFLKRTWRCVGTQRRYGRRLTAFGIGRLGNQMFVYASLLGIAAMNCMTPVYRGDRTLPWLENTFANLTYLFRAAETGSGTSVLSVSTETEGAGFRAETTPITTTTTTAATNTSTAGQTEFSELSVYYYDRRFELLHELNSDVTLRFWTFLQSWKYFYRIQDEIRRQFTFKAEHQLAADGFLATISTKYRNYTSEDAAVLFVGVHIRRGDFFHYLGTGYYDVGYFERAIGHMLDRFPDSCIRFVVCSDGPRWAQLNFVRLVDRVVKNKTSVSGRRSSSTARSSQDAPIGNSVGFLSSAVNAKSPVIGAEVTRTRTSTRTRRICKPTVDVSIGRSASADLAILASCNHSIVTAGSFGWWAAWLANGHTVYYGNYPPFDRRNLTSHARDYVPIGWHGIV